MATFKVRESGYVQAVVRRKGWPQQSKSFRTKTDAETWARQVETEMDRGSFVSASLAQRTTFSDIVDRFTKEFAPFHYRKREDKKEAWRFQCAHLNKFFGEYSMAALTPQLVAKYRDERLKTVGASTVRKELNMLSKVLTVAGQEFGVAVPTGNPVLNVRKPQEAKSRERRLNGDDFQLLLSECGKSRNPWLLHAVNFAVATAMRQGEILALRWENINPARRLAMLPETKNGESRAAPLTSEALAILNSLPRAIKGVVFPVERMTLYHAFNAAVKRAGIADYTFHDLRHEALSRLAERGDLTVLELADISGHKTLQMLKRYTHLRAEDLARKLG
jgi:integrase